MTAHSRQNSSLVLRWNNTGLHSASSRVKKTGAVVERIGQRARSPVDPLRARPRERRTREQDSDRAHHSSFYFTESRHSPRHVHRLCPIEKCRDRLVVYARESIFTVTIFVLLFFLIVDFCLFCFYVSVVVALNVPV